MQSGGRRAERSGPDDRHAMLERPPAGTIPDAPGSYQFKDARRPGHLRGQGQEPAQRLSNYFQNPRNLPPRTAQMVATAERVEWIEVAQRGRGALPRVQPHQAAPAPLQHPPEGRQELPVPGGHPRRGVAPGDGDAGRASARASATSARTRTPTRSARRSTCCCARSRSARARDNKFDRHHRLGRPCLLFHIEKCAAPCVGEIDQAGLRRAGRRSCSTSSTATPTPVVDRLDGADARGGRRARVRAGGPAARPARRGAQGHRDASRWWASATRTSTSSASPTTSSRRRCRCSSCARAGWSGRKGFIVDKVEDVDAEPS